MYNKIDWNALRDKAYKCAKAHGWHEKRYSDKHFLMLIVTEIAETVNADRKNRYAEVAKFKEWQGNNVPLSEETRKRRFNEDFDAYIKDTVEDEFADVIIRSLDLAGLLGIDLTSLDDLLKQEDKLLEMSNIQHVDFGEQALELVEIVVDDDKLSTTILATIFCTYLWTQKLNIDILWHIEQKLRYNETREYRYGKKY